MLILSDFDGTITVRDLTSAVWDRYVPDWRRRLLPASESGEITAFEMIRRGYAEVAAPPAEVAEIVRAEAEIRAGFDRLVAQVRARGWLLAVVSNGLSFYIADLVPPGVPIFAYDARYDGGRWQVTLPSKGDLGVDPTPPPGGDFKVHVLAELRARQPGAPTAYIGDGRLDFEAARRCDRIFAVRGSPLVRLCARAGLACSEFDTFDDVVAAL